jgi:subtilisin family serine protease
VRVYQFRHIRVERKSSRGYASGLQRGLLVVAALLGLGSLGGAGAAANNAPMGRVVEVVVELKRPPLATSFGLHARRSRAYLRTLASAQSRLEARIERALPGARVRWRYRYVLDALAVVLPVSEVDRLLQLPGVAHVDRSVGYRALLDQSVPLINAPALWGPTRATAGQGMKIGIIDDGVDQAHQFFSSAGYAYPPGFPKGNTAYTTPKVIVARAFPPPSTHWKYAGRPFDPVNSEHATHVAGIAAGNYDATQRNGRPVSGVAPRAYIGNYKVLTVPTPQVGLDGNSPEIVKGIDAAVADGMNVINLSLGEPEIEPGRDIVVQALNAAADAGVVPVVAAGNDFADFGYGSISSPGNAAKAITAAAVTKDDQIADFSSAGPSGIDLGFKPDVSAPGVGIYSSVPSGWDSFSGTSMATPHVAAGAALLLERHPGWTVEQVKSALVLTGRPVWTDSSHRRETPATREGGGLIDLAAANNPLLFATPSDVSFGFVRGQTVTRTIGLTDAGGGAGVWTTGVQIQQGAGKLALSLPPAVDVPGSLTISTRSDGGSAREVTGFLLLNRGAVSRRIPFWFRVSNPQLGSDPHGRLGRPGVYRGTTARKAARVSCYRYPADPSPLGVPGCLRGPEQVFRVSLRQPVANFGVAIISRGPGVRVQPRVVYAGDEDRLTGYAGLPLNLNPYLSAFGEVVLVAGAIRPAAGAYDVVFDTPSRRSAGAFTFRFWVDDTTPPRITLQSRSVPRDRVLLARITDSGAGVDPGAVHAAVDGTAVAAHFRSGQALISTLGLAPGRHTLVLRASDYQETKNMENTGPILPNTATLRTGFTVR